MTHVNLSTIYSVLLIVFSSEAIDEALVPCSICNRTFMPETLVRL